MISPIIHSIENRFVYHETLARSLKQLGVKNDIADFDALKLEKGKQTLYGLIETASIILANTGILIL